MTYPAVMGRRRIPEVWAPTPRTLHGSIVVDRLDLHGSDVEQAERRLAMFLERVSVNEPGGVVRIVTGKGTGSDERPVIREMVLEALNGCLRDAVDDWSIEEGAGAYLVRVKSPTG